MIAYNHSIKFIPQLKNDKKTEGSFSDIVTVQENSGFELNEKLLYELTFFNNQGRDLMLYTDREFARTQKGQIWAFEVKDVVTFFWQSGTLTLEYMRHDNFTEELLEYWCLHIVLPVFFTIEETFDFLHAGAVEVEGKSILFIAESFGGKSTMTDYFMKQGHAVVSDDKVATYEEDGQFFAVPSHPHHRPYRKIEDLGLFVKNFAKETKPIFAIYDIELVDLNDPIVFSELQGIQKFKALRKSSEINLSSLMPNRFKFLSILLRKTPVFRVTIPKNLDRLEEVYKAIIENIWYNTKNRRKIL